MSVRRVGTERAGLLAALHARAFETPWSEEAMTELLRGPGAVAFAAEDGFVLARVLPEEAEVLTLAVAPEGRRRGTGRALLQAAAAEADRAGAEAMFLEVAADNAPALALYAGAGFREVGRRRAYYAREGRGAADALVLRRALPSPEG